jgi:small ligand-binding sensory domain FIST
MTKSTARAASRIRLLTWDEDEVIATARELRAETGGATIAFAYASADWRPHIAAFVEILQVEGHARCVVGCSADGIIGTGEEDESVSGFSVLFLNLPDVHVSTWMIDSEFQIPHGLRTDGCWIVTGHPGRLNAQMLLEDMNRVYPGVPVFGGMAGGGWEADSIFHFHSGLKTEDAAGIAVHLAGAHVEGIVSQGCQPIGEPYTITRVEEDLVYAVGGRRAYDVLTETFESLPEEEKTHARGGNIMAGLAASEYREEFRRGDFLVRNILGGDPRTGAIKLGAVPRVGQTLQFQLREKDAADEDLRVQCSESLKRDGEPLAALVFCCTGRGQHLFGVPNHDAGIFAETFGPVPVAGFFANGEFGPVAGVNFVHGYTASAAVFYP